jgi:hypothetical protein
MSLRLESWEQVSTSDLTDVTWSIESPTIGVVVIDVRVGSDFTPAPLHWRAGDWTKPPLDLAFSPDGRLETIQIVLQDETLGGAGSRIDVPVVAGHATFDVQRWPADRYLDERIAVVTERLDSDVILVTIGSSKAIRFNRVAHSLTLGFNRGDRLAQIWIGPLGTNEWALIQSAAR